MVKLSDIWVNDMNIDYVKGMSILIMVGVKKKTVIMLKFIVEPYANAMM